MSRPRSFDLDEVLDAAMQVFWSQGFDATGVQDLCRATGLNPGSLYAAFGDKRGLFLQALQRYMAVVSRESIARMHSGRSGLDGLRRYFESLVDAMVDGKRRQGCLVTNTMVEFALADPEIAEAFRVHLARLESAFASAIERAREAGELPPGVPSDDAAAFLVCTVQGMNVLARTQPGRSALSSHARLALSVLGGAQPLPALD